MQAGTPPFTLPVYVQNQPKMYKMKQHTCPGAEDLPGTLPFQSTDPLVLPCSLFTCSGNADGAWSPPTSLALAACTLATASIWVDEDTAQLDCVHTGECGFIQSSGCGSVCLAYPLQMT